MLYQSRQPVSSRTKAKTTVEKIVARFGLPTREVEPGLWVVLTPEQYSYRTHLFLWSGESHIHCRATFDMTFGRDQIPAELALLLLVENSRSAAASFCLAPNDDDRLVVQQQDVPASDDVESVVAAGQAMLQRMQHLVCRLYGSDLIPTRADNY